MDTLISLTDAAVTHIHNLMNEEKDAIGFRLSLKKTGCSGYAYVPEIAKKLIENDIHFVAQNNLQVYVDPTYQDFIKGLLIDYVEETKAGLKQKRLVFINPREQSRCGCGESFTLEKNDNAI
jgi:iron-sulfur cluster assembly protein